MEISVDIIVFFAVSALLMVEGIYSFLNGKPMSSSPSTKKSAEKYEPKSYKTANKVLGVFTFLAGLVFFINQLGRVMGWLENLLPSLIALGVFLIGVILYFILLKKKSKSSSSGKHPSGNISGYGDD